MVNILIMCWWWWIVRQPTFNTARTNLIRELNDSIFNPIQKK